MLLTLVKNNFKLMLRDKMSMLFLIFLPILLIAILSSAFSQEMNKNYIMKPFTVGYSVKFYPQNYLNYSDIFIKCILLAQGFI